MLTRHRGSRAPTLLVAAILAAVIVAGCRAEPVDESGLDDIEDSDPVEAEEPEPDPEDDPSEDEGADEPEGDGSAEALDESDGDGGLIPESAFEINDDLDLDAEAQMSLLRRYARGVEQITRLYAGGEVTDAALSEHFTPSQVARIRNSWRTLRDGNEVQRSEDAEVVYLRLEEFAGGGAVIHRCQRNGPETGIYDAESETLVFSAPNEWELFAAQMVLLIGDDDVARWVQDDGAVIDDTPCD